jgi:hypothetical protein
MNRNFGKKMSGMRLIRYDGFCEVIGTQESFSGNGGAGEVAAPDAEPELEAPAAAAAACPLPETGSGGIFVPSTT